MTDIDGPWPKLKPEFARIPKLKLVRRNPNVPLLDLATRCCAVCGGEKRGWEFSSEERPGDEPICFQCQRGVGGSFRSYYKLGVSHGDRGVIHRAHAALRFLEREIAQR